MILLYVYNSGHVAAYYAPTQLPTTQGSFMRYMSHEMRTPLNIMNLSVVFVETEAADLRARGLVDRKRIAPLLDAIGDIKESCQTATSLLDDFLTLDKMQGGKMAVELIDVDPMKFALETYRQFVLIARQSGIDYQLECDEAESGWTQQICLHLDIM